MLGDPRLIEAILENIHDGIYCVDTDRRIRYWNAAAERLTGYAAAEVIGRSCSDDILTHLDADGNPLCRTSCPMATVLAEGASITADMFCQHRSGHRLPVEVRIVPLRDGAGAIVGALEVFDDNSEKIAAIRKAQDLERLALEDPLTGLANRRLAESHLRSSLAEMMRLDSPFGVLMIDVDNFKRINDGLGHDVGDRVLQLIARTLKGAARAYDMVGRWGGEEFVVSIGHIDGDNLARTAERYRKLIERSRLSVGGRRIELTVSIGATRARPGDTVSEVIRRADRMLYRSKRLGRNMVTVDAKDAPPREMEEPAA